MGGLSGVHQNGKWDWNSAWKGAGMGAAGGFVLGGASTAIGNWISGRNIWNGNLKIKPTPVITIEPKNNADEVLKDYITPKSNIQAEESYGEFPGGNLRDSKGTFIQNKAGSDVQFGQNQNQRYHTFRHTNKAGLNELDVEKTVRLHVNMNSSKIQTGQISNFSTNVNNQIITYSAFRLPNGIINIGRITIP